MKFVLKKNVSGQFQEETCVDKTVFSMPNSGVQYVEKNVMTYQRKTG
jgi:hypothetical protein